VLKQTDASERGDPKMIRVNVAGAGRIVVVVGRWGRESTGGGGRGSGLFGGVGRGLGSGRSEEVDGGFSAHHETISDE
jgi:hypothetical protein